MTTPRSSDQMSEREKGRITDDEVCDLVRLTHAENDRAMLKLIVEEYAYGRHLVDQHRTIHRDTITPLPYGLRKQAHRNVTAGVASMRWAIREKRRFLRSRE